MDITARAPQSDSETVIRQFYEFHNVGDADARDALWVEDATLTLPNGTVYEGRTEILAHPSGHSQIVVSDLIVNGSTVTWTSTAGGQVYLLEAVVEDGQIQSMRFR